MEILVVTGVEFGDRLFRGRTWSVAAPAEIAELIAALHQHAGTERGGNDHLTALRMAASRRASAITSAFAPDVIVSTSHRGVFGEADDLLRSSRERGCRLVLALRDIYYPPMYVDDFGSMSGNEFDLVLVAGRSATQEWLPEGLFDGGLAPKVRLVGYLRPVGPQPAPVTAWGESLRVRCQVGGGRDGARLVAAVADALAALRRRSGRRVELLATTGPLMPAAEASALQSIDQADTQIRPWSDDIVGPAAALEPRPDVVVSMAGYNSCVEAAWSGVPRVLVPRQKPDDLEQAIRARLFAKWFSSISTASLEHPHGLSPAIEAAAAAKATKHPSTEPVHVFADPRLVASAVLGLS
ncbi:glycosyltransferase [Micromonospora aurantiaca]|uniref:Glycosyl transferase family 28 C-terminal domain-containing protein n=1 Tax=Micromonospora aurantiaca (nom. illeg.) TaxID=47850 RepID=A0A6N3K5W1_9ACTN|nr:glycosyltransferase [Micromonospora aurantiaca]AXH93545.1 hypothetical protein DVH21_28485 [Micromonospora aurantiaca]